MAEPIPSSCKWEVRVDRMDGGVWSHINVNGTTLSQALFEAAHKTLEWEMEDYRKELKKKRKGKA